MNSKEEKYKKIHIQAHHSTDEESQTHWKPWKHQEKNGFSVSRKPLKVKGLTSLQQWRSVLTHASTFALVALPPNVHPPHLSQSRIFKMKIRPRDSSTQLSSGVPHDIQNAPHVFNSQDFQRLLSLQWFFCHFLNTLLL